MKHQSRRRNIKRRAKNLDHDILTVDQAAAFLQVSRVTIYRMLKDGEVPARRVRGRWRFSKRGLMRWIEEETWESTDGGVK